MDMERDRLLLKTHKSPCLQANPEIEMDYFYLTSSHPYCTLISIQLVPTWLIICFQHLSLCKWCNFVALHISSTMFKRFSKCHATFGPLRLEKTARCCHGNMDTSLACIVSRVVKESRRMVMGDIQPCDTVCVKLEPDYPLLI